MITNFALLTVVAALGLVLSLTSCATHKQYRGNLAQPLGEPDSESPVWKEAGTGTPYFGILEFDDLGERWDSSRRASHDPAHPATQLEAVTDAITKVATSHKSVFLVVFAHGWRNNASKANYNDGNLKEFHQKIKQLREFHKTDGSQVFGVYLAWRGKTPSWPLDFYHRNEGGHRVGERATGSLFTLLAAARKAPESKIALIGHSFGSHVIEGAVSNSIQARVAEAAVNKTTPNPVADLVLLINPARSSLYAKPLIDQLRSQNVTAAAPNAPHQLPLIVCLSSETDWYNGQLFPFGYWLGRRISLFNTGVSGERRDPTKWDDPVSQDDTLKRTLGWNTALHSHQVVKHPYPDKKRHHAPSDSEITAANQNPWEADASTFIVHGQKYWYEVKPIPQAYNDTAYWAMQVPKDIVDGHNDIWNDEYTAMVTALMYLNNTAPTAGKPAVRNLFEQKVRMQLR